MSRDFCSQCGQSFEARSCGPTHALISYERAMSRSEISGASVNYILEDHRDKIAALTGICKLLAEEIEALRKDLDATKK